MPPETEQFFQVSCNQQPNSSLWLRTMGGDPRTHVVQDILKHQAGSLISRAFELQKKCPGGNDCQDCSVARFIQAFERYGGEDLVNKIIELFINNSGVHLLSDDEDVLLPGTDSPNLILG